MILTAIVSLVTLVAGLIWGFISGVRFNNEGEQFTNTTRVKFAQAVLLEHVKPDGISDSEAISRMYEIFDDGSGR